MKTYERVGDLIADAVASGQYPEGLPSERDLAAEYGVSRGSVEKALARLERLGVIAEERGTGGVTPRRKTHGKKTSVVFLSSTCPFDGYLTSFFEGAYHAARRVAPASMEIQPRFCDFDHAREARILVDLLERSPRGILALPFVRQHRLVHLDEWQKLLLKGVRIVFLFRDIRELIAPSLSIDQRAVIDAFVDRLRGQGCDHFIDGGNTAPVPGRAEAWRLYYEDGKNFHTLPLPVSSPDGALRRKAIASALEGLRLPPDASPGLFCADAADALLAHQVLGRSPFRKYHVLHDGRMPGLNFERYGLTGETLPESLEHPAVMDYRADEMGVAAIDLLGRMIEKDTPYATSMVFRPAFGIRPSIGVSP